MQQGKAERKQRRERNSGFLAFFISGICVISSGIIVSMLQEIYGFAYGMTGTLLALMSIGNLIAGFVTGILPGKIGTRKTVALLTSGYAIGYFCMGLSGVMIILMLAFFLLGVAKGCTINTCTILVGDNSENRTKGMNMMHSCYTLGALLSPFAIAFVIPIKNAYLAMIKMGIGCIVFYLGMMLADSQLPAILLLFAFAFAMAGMNPTAVACAGKMTSATSIGVMLPAASAGAILMPWLTGVISQYAGLRVGMASNIVPCIGLLVFAVLVKREEK